MEKDDVIKEYENKFMFLNALNLYHKRLSSRLSEEDNKTLNNIFEKNISNTISAADLLGPYLNKRSKSDMEIFEVFLDSLEMDNIEMQISSLINTHTRTRKSKFFKSNSKFLNSGPDYTLLKERYAYVGTSNTPADLMARFNADTGEKLKSFNLDYFKTMLNAAVKIKWSDVEDYEARLFEKEMKLFQNIEKTKTTTQEYNELLEKACKQEIKRHDIILATCIVSHMKALSEVRIEQLIVDEAAMIKEPEVLVPIILCRPNKIVLIGDHKQLRCITKCAQAAEFGFDRSLFERYHKNLTMLEEQYRMHPSICKFSSSIFYKKKLITGTVGPFKSPLQWPKIFRDEKEFQRMKHTNKGYDRRDFDAFRIVFLDVKGNYTQKLNLFNRKCS